MATIELVIRIPEDEYQNILHTGEASFYTVNAIEAGRPLPKGHGRLIDADALKETFIEPNSYLKCNEKGLWCFTGKEIRNAPTIIEADKYE